MNYKHLWMKKVSSIKHHYFIWASCMQYLFWMFRDFSFFFFGLDQRWNKWTPVGAKEACPKFPTLCNDEIREMTLGLYQVKLARSHAPEHCDNDGSYKIFVSTDCFICGNSKQNNAKRYKLWIKHNNNLINGCFCTCKSGSRVIGMCAHITSVIWYLLYIRHEENALKTFQIWLMPFRMRQEKQSWTRQTAMTRRNRVHVFA